MAITYDTILSTCTAWLQGCLQTVYPAKHLGPGDEEYAAERIGTGDKLDGEWHYLVSQLAQSTEDLNSNRLRLTLRLRGLWSLTHADHTQLGRIVSACSRLMRALQTTTAPANTSVRYGGELDAGEGDRPDPSVEFATILGALVAELQVTFILIVEG
jgi:hypothetical protein